MPPIHMTARERAALARLTRMPAPTTEIRREHGEKLVSHGLVVKEAFRFKITTKGQLELLRQRFRGMSTRRTTHSSGHDFIEKLKTRLVNGLDEPSASGEEEDATG